MILIVFVGIENFVFVDECGVQNDFRRKRARAKRGVRVHAQDRVKSRKEPMLLRGFGTRNM